MNFEIEHAKKGTYTVKGQSFPKNAQQKGKNANKKDTKKTHVLYPLLWHGKKQRFTTSLRL